MVGKLVIKASIGTDIRILPISNEDLTYDELVLMMQRVFKDVLAGYQGNLILKYKDDAGDLISVPDTNALTYALHDTQQVLRLHIYLPEELNACYMMPQATADEVRRKCHSLLALLDTLPLSPPSPAAPAPSSPPSQPPAHDVPTTEFDPLSQENTPPPSATKPSGVTMATAPTVTMATATSTNGSTSSAPSTNGAPGRPAPSPLPTAAVRAVAAAKPHTPQPPQPHAVPHPQHPQHPQHPHYAIQQGQNLPAGYYGAPQQMYPQQPTPPMYHPSPPTSSFYTPYHHAYRPQAPYRPQDGN